MYYLFEYEGCDLDDDLFDYSCSGEMEKLYNYFEETEFLKRAFKKYNIWEEEEFRDEFEDELYDKKNPKWYSLDCDDHITDGKVDWQSPAHGSPSYYVLVNKKKKTTKTFTCFDVAMFYVFKKDYNGFNKDYIEWVINESQK